MPGFEGLKPELVAGFERVMSERAIVSVFDTSEPAEDVLAQIDGESVAELIADIVDSLKKGYPQAGIRNLTGSTYYLQAVRETAFRGAMRDIGAADSEDDAELMKVTGKISPQGVRQIVSSLFSAIEVTPEDPGFLAMIRPSLRLYALELEREDGVNGPYLETIMQEVQKKDRELGLSSEEIEREWKVARSSLRAWDLIDEELRERRSLQKSNSQELIPTEDVHALEDLRRLVDQRLIFKKEPALPKGPDAPREIEQSKEQQLKEE